LGAEMTLLWVLILVLLVVAAIAHRQSDEKFIAIKWAAIGGAIAFFLIAGWFR
jgi:Flp pilus assembly protein protease CpaA